MKFEPVKNKKTVPCCPNHGEPLEGLPSPLTTKGKGRCPISKVKFEYSIQIEQEDTEYVKDHNGNLTAVPTFKVIGDENGGVF